MAVLPALCLATLCVAVWMRKAGARERGLPPGPPTLPIIGNLHLFPTEFTHLQFTEWARTYGGIYSLKLGSGTAIVLTDAAAAKELLDKRSANTGDRPVMSVAELTTGGLNFGVAHYGELWKTMRKTAHSILSPTAATRHLPIQRAESTQLMHDILHSPQSFYTHVQRYAGSVILSVLYGKRAPQYETPEITQWFHLEGEWSRLLEAGATPPVDLFPILKLIPERWAKWRRDCLKVRGLQQALYFGLLDETTERLRKGEENGCYMEEVLAKQAEFGMSREMTAYFGGTLIEGASATTASYLQSFILAMVAYPDAQKKAQAEMDLIVGEDRMPTLEDLEHMPYIRALILEAHRFRPTLPLLVPHATIAPEEFNGYIIPKETTVFVNAWGILHDPALYDDPENFIPDRYMLNENGTKPGVDGSDVKPNFVFGFGRRVCPGIYLGQNSININVLNLVWAFDFKPAIDAGGNPVQPDLFAYAKGLAAVPHPFKCRIIPRTAMKAKIIEREFVEAGPTFEKFELGLSPEDKEFVAKARPGLHGD
ncbi:cytochrome P450 [Mycena polygramma]|nr:cytochrome P450 [Mycena polygramma]